MARDEAYREAERRIEIAKETGAIGLDLSNMGLTELPEAIGQLVNLQILKLGDIDQPGSNKNQLNILPECLGNLTQLQGLSLSNNQLSILPEWLGNLTQLQKLYLRNNQINILPEWLGNLTQLWELSLSSNQLIALPESLGNLIELKRLSLRNNNLVALPESLGNLGSLQKLFLDNNKLVALPESLGNLICLQKLNVSDNKLVTLPESLGNLVCLRKLNVSNNKLVKLPKSLSNLACLQRLDFGSNELSVFPEFSGYLNHLKELYLDSNKLEYLPEDLGRLTQLKELFLNDNKLKFLPESLGNLTKLQKLSLDSNQLSALPKSLDNLAQLQRFYLDDNPLNPELAAAYKQGTEGVKIYLRALSEGEVALDEAKLILVGEGEVGKTCLLGALRGDRWIEGRPTTHGIEIKPVTVLDRDRNVEITLNGWDFGGQRVYRPTHQLFFSAPAVYLVVWKPREGPQQGFVREWVKLIEHREPDAKIIVVATHGGPQQRQPDIDTQELIDRFGKDTICGFFFVDSKPSTDGECKNVTALKEKIAEVVASLPGVGRKIPAKWHRVREALKATGKPYLPYQEAIALCENAGVEGFMAESCIRVYHTLGNIIHYEYNYDRDPGLQDIIILKPDWLAKAISFVLDDKETRDRNGLVTFDRLSQLWRDPPFENETGYPSELFPLFVRLMEEFDLCYQVVFDAPDRDREKTYLIGQLVQDNRPQEKLEAYWGDMPREGESQQMQICRIVDDRGQLANAEGLFYQLIVRLHKYSLGRDDYYNSIHWKRGLVLDYDYNGRALLEHIDTNIRITVRAAFPEFFLYQLTREVKWLVEHFWEGLNCEIVVPCIEPCGKNQPGWGQFEVEKLIESKRQGMPKFPCMVSGCNSWLDIDELMRNAPTPVQPEAMLSEQISDLGNELKQSVRTIRQEICVLDRRDRDRFQSLDRGQKEILSKVDRQFSALLQMFADEAKEGPRLFSFKPLNPRFNPAKWLKEEFQLTLWCEHSRQPLPALNPDDPKKGVYKLTLTREWFAKATPYLKFMTTTIGLVLPLASSATKALLDEAVYENIENELDLAQQSIEASIKGGEMGIDWLGKGDTLEVDRDRKAIEAQGAMLRQLHIYLKEKDPSFGGLDRVQNKRHEFLWVHPQFRGEY